MKAALFYGGSDIRVEELPVPEPGPGEVLIRVRSAGICGSDLHGYRRRRPAHRNNEAPQAAPREAHQSGHELAGEVAALGPDVISLSVGQRVGIEPEHLIGCGTCSACRRGDTHLCPTRGMRHGTRHSSHGFSEYDVCLAGNVHPLPDNVSLDVAAILDCYGCAVHAIHRAPVSPYSTAVVLGTGTIGMSVGQVARAGGAGRVLMVGRREPPLAIARRAGACDVGLPGDQVDPVQAVLDLTRGEGADVVFETVGGSAATFPQAIQMARRGGTVCILGMFAEPQTLDIGQAYRKELNIIWSNSYATWNGISEYTIGLDLVASDRVHVEPLLTHHFPLERIDEAFAVANDKRTSGAIKVLLHA